VGGKRGVNYGKKGGGYNGKNDEKLPGGEERATIAMIKTKLFSQRMVEGGGGFGRRKDVAQPKVYYEID